MRNGLRIRIKSYTSVQCETFNTGARGCNDQQRKSTEFKKNLTKYFSKCSESFQNHFPALLRVFLSLNQNLLQINNSSFCSAFPCNKFE